MQVTVDISFEEITASVKKLSKADWERLKAKVDEFHLNNDNLEDFLLNGPVYDKKQLKVIAGNRKAINKWR